MGAFLRKLRDAVAFVRSYGSAQTLASSRGQMPRVKVVQRRGKKRLDGPTVNYSFGTLHTILAEAFARVDVRARGARSVLLLGLGAGSAVSLLRTVHGVAGPIVGVELDPEVVRLAREHFGLGRWRDLEVVVADAAEFVAADTRTFDLVVVDVFVDAAVPEACRGRPFFAHVRERLAPGGLLLFNLVVDTAAGADARPAVEAALRAELGQVTAMPIRSNVVFAAERVTLAP